MTNDNEQKRIANDLQRIGLLLPESIEGVQPEYCFVCGMPLSNSTIKRIIKKHEIALATPEKRDKLKDALVDYVNSEITKAVDKTIGEIERLSELINKEGL